MTQNRTFTSIDAILRRQPDAWARLKGSSQRPGLRGMIRFYRHALGTLIVAEVQGLPTHQDACASPIFAFHIHEGDSCTGDRQDPFADVGTHYNPHSCPHPYHAGDLPPMFSAKGHGVSAFLTDRFTVGEIVGKTILLHAGFDDFSSQPSGNAGAKIACGEIVRGTGTGSQCL